MSAMPAVELPEEPADLLAIVAAVQPVQSGAPSVACIMPHTESAASRAATRWAQPAPAAALSTAVLPPTVAPAPIAPATAASAPAVQASQPAPSSRQAMSAPLRLTRRGRIVIGVATVVLLTAMSLVAALSAQATSQAPARAGQGLSQVTVLPGQSLWSVAENADPSADTRAVVQQIVELNSLTGSAVYAGQHLWVPRG